MLNMNRYIIKQLLVPTLFITFALTGVIWLSQTLQFVEKLIEGLPVSTFLTLTVLLLPGILKYTLLLGLFFGTLFAFNKLYSESELVVMWSAGLSNLSLTKAAVYLAFVVMIILYLLNFFLTPYGLRTVRELRVEWRESLASVVLREGVFNDLSSNVTVYIREKTRNGRLLGILVHDETVPEKPVTYMAEEGAFITTDAGPRFFMRKGNIQEVQKEEAKLSILYFEDYTLDLSQYEKETGAIWLKPSTRYFSELVWPENDKTTLRNMDKIKQELHQRMALPLYAICLTLIAIAGVIGGEFTRRGRPKQLLAAGASGIVAMVVAMASFSLGPKHALLVALIYIWPVIVALVALHFIRKGGGFESNSHASPNPHLAEGGA
ncbi:LptF/LptG family permease [Sneathiella sp. P13V-1]|uniref:LptF/LptG family permease n=1 Tax=Sneathiella sp. P13V-1 TaxID=2697366 RepID=UPI00187B3094|nr:LptF/LptG family permease [Sneathiella sp. P13V-1]MBE7637015.1 LptF/LptG family permease [Sneathiella sp. P13V-1]